MSDLRRFGAVLALVALAACSQEAGEADAERSAAGGSTFNVSLATVEESGVQGLVTVSPARDSVMLKLELMGLQGGESYPVVLRSGTCESPGAEVMELNAPTSGSIGIGSSTTAVSTRTLASDAHNIEARLPDGSPAACGDIPEGRIRAP